MKSASPAADPPQVATLITGRNVNMVSGTTLPWGDPWLQRQNEPSIAVSSRNPLHLLAGANDYRTVDMAASEGELPGISGAAGGDAWLGVFKSFDGGESWKTTLLPGSPLDSTALSAASPIKGFTTAADPIVRAGTNGLFYYTGIAFNRAVKGGGAFFVSRFIDNNNVEGGDAIKYLDTKIICQGTSGQFIDMPRIAVDIPRSGAKTVTVDGQSIQAGNIYAAYTVFLGNLDINVRSRIMVTRSTDCGVTWSAPLKISESQHIIQGSAFAIDPVTGYVYVAFRRFKSASETNAVLICKSTDGGLTFSKPALIDNIVPFDQPATDAAGNGVTDPLGTSFRTNSYPTLAVDGQSIVYAAWADRRFGYARIFVTSSMGGATWSMPAAIDTSNAVGHQVMPFLTYASGKIMAIWYDQRYTGASIDNWISDNSSIRQTVDIRAALVSPGAFPPSASVQVSRYLWVYDPVQDELFQGQWNPPNYPLFKGGTVPFHGDYVELVSAPTFIRDPNGSWRFNTDTPNPVFHAVWTDNRDVRPPVDNNWTNYNPPSPALATLSSGSCNPANTGMRNQNIYTSRLTSELVVDIPGNAKPLGGLGNYFGTNDQIPRAFVIFVKNTSGDIKVLRFEILAAPASGSASFMEFNALTQVDSVIAPYSTVARTVFVTSTDPYALATVGYHELDFSGNPLPGGLSGTVVVNSDPSYPGLPPDSTLKNNEYHNPNIVNPNIVNWTAVNPNIVNPNIVNPNIVNYSIINPNIVNRDFLNPNIVNPNIVNRNIYSNPNIVNPNIVNPNIVNSSAEGMDGNQSVSDVKCTLRNEGNTISAFSLKTFSKEAFPEGLYLQLLVYKTSYTPAADGVDCTLKQEQHQELLLNVVNPNIVNPNIVNPNIVNPNIVNAAIENASFSLAPGEEAEVCLRIINPNPGPAIMMKTGKAFSMETFLESVGFAATAQAVNSEDAKTVEKEKLAPKAAASKLVIGTSSLPDGKLGESYPGLLSAYGGTTPYSWALTSGELPSGLQLISSTGEIWGTPGVAGTFHFIVRVDDSAGDFDTQRYSIYVYAGTPATLAITTTSLPNGVMGYYYGAALEATGGVWPRTWTLTPGSAPLPPGLSLDSGGVISGTPTTIGTYQFSARVTDATGASNDQGLSIIVNQSTGQNFTISGYVYDGQGQPLEGAVMRGLPNTPESNANGYYQDTVPEHWTGTVIPFMAEVAFTPPSRPYTDITAPYSQQDYNQPMQVPVSTISGRLMYNGIPLPQYPSSQVSLWARDEGTGESFPITPTYNPNDGTYSLPNVPSGTYGIRVAIDTAQPFDGKYLPGDFYGWTSPITVDAPNPENRDLNCQKLIHLTSPVDNINLPAVPMPPPYDTFIPPTTFQWDAIAEATTYTIGVDKYQDVPYDAIQYDVLNVTGITTTQYQLSLPVCGANEHYELHLYAYNANNVFVGQLMVWYSSGYGWDYRFKLISPSPISTLLTNLEYPTGMWIRENDLYIIESAGHNTSWGGKVNLDRYDIALGQLTTLVTDPENAYAVAAGTGNDTYIYLTSYQDQIPGEFGMVSWVNPTTNGETHLLDLEIASCDMYIDDGGDIYIIGSSNQADAKSLYRLPYGSYTNPQVLQTGLGRIWCLSKHGDYIYFSDQSSIKRFNVNTPGVVETFADKSVMSISFSAEHLYYADYFGGTVGRINLSTMADETLASGLNSPQVVRYDPASYKVYFVEVGTDANHFKDGTLKVIDLN